MPTSQELMLTSFYFIRHGQTDWNIERKIMGQTDIPLNQTGIQQAHTIVKTLKGHEIQTICYSPLVRAKQTAFILNKNLDCSMVEIDNLKECCWGTLQGQFKTEGQYLKNWILGETPEGAEHYQDFLIRAISGINEALAQPGPILIVSHGGIYWAIQNALGQKERNQSSSLPHCELIYHRPPTEGKGPWIVAAMSQGYTQDQYDYY